MPLNTLEQLTTGSTTLVKQGLKRMNVYDQRKHEDQFTAWVNVSDEKVEQYGEALDMLADAYYDNEKINEVRIFKRGSTKVQMCSISYTKCKTLLKTS